MRLRRLIVEGIRLESQGGVSGQSCFRWRKEYGGFRTDQAKRLKKLEKENGRLRKAVSDLTLDKLILKWALTAGSGNHLAKRRQADLRCEWATADPSTRPALNSTLDRGPLIGGRPNHLLRHNFARLLPVAGHPMQPQVRQINHLIL